MPERLIDSRTVTGVDDDGILSFFDGYFSVGGNDASHFKVAGDRFCENPKRFIIDWMFFE